MQQWRERAAAPLTVFGGPSAVPEWAVPPPDSFPPASQEGTPPAPGGENFALQVQAWLASQQEKQEPKFKGPPPLSKQEPAPPPIPDMGESSGVSGTPQPWKTQSSGREWDPAPPLPIATQTRIQKPAPPLSIATKTGKWGPAPPPSISEQKKRTLADLWAVAAKEKEKMEQDKPVDAAAARSILAGVLGNLKNAKRAHDAAASVPSMPAFPTQELQQFRGGSLATGPSISPGASSSTANTQPISGSYERRSRSRGNRSQSRGRRSHSPGRALEWRPPAVGFSTAPTFESRTIQITEGTVGTRLWLKKEMEKFGRVEVCHTGNRQNPVAEPPWVRFEKMSSVEVALQAINSGQVFFDGLPIKAESKTNGRQRQPEVREPRQRSPRRRDMDITSRDLARDDRRGRDGPGSRQGPGNYSSRELMRDEGRRHSRRSSSHSRSRSRSRRYRRY